MNITKDTGSSVSQTKRDLLQLCCLKTTVAKSKIMMEGGNRQLKKPSIYFDAFLFPQSGGRTLRFATFRCNVFFVPTRANWAYALKRECWESISFQRCKASLA
jgi:hypothetical protein